MGAILKLTRNSCHRLMKYLNDFIDFAKTKNPWRIILFLVCSGNLVYQLYCIFLGYVYNGYSSRILQLEQSEIELPYIRICSPNWPNVSALVGLGITPKMFDYFTQMFEEGYFTKSSDSVSWDEEHLDVIYQTNLQKINYRVADFFQKITQKCNHVFRQCFFGKLLIDCCNNSRVQLYIRGPCYVFNIRGGRPTRPFKQRNAGPAGGFMFHYISDVDNSVPYNITRLPNYDGLILSTIEEDSALLNIETDPIGIEPGANALVQLDMTKTRRITNCMEYKLAKTDDIGTDHHGVCSRNHALQEIKNKCSCLAINYDASVWNSSFCTPNKLRACVYPLLRDYALKMTWDQHCETSCSQLEFTQRVSTSHFNQRMFKKLDDPELGDNQMVTEVVVFMAYLGFMSIEEVAMQTWQILVANIGGQFGLWLGLSVFGLITSSVIMIRSYFE